MTQVSTQSNPWDLAPIIGKSDRSWQDDREARDSRPWDFAPIIESSPGPTLDSPAWQDSPEQQTAPGAPPAGTGHWTRSLMGEPPAAREPVPAAGTRGIGGNFISGLRETVVDNLPEFAQKAMGYDPSLPARMQDRPSEPGTGQFVGQAIGGVVPSIKHPESLAFGLGAAGAAERAALPLVTKIEALAGPRVANAARSALGGAGGSAPMGAIEEAQRNPEEWATNPAEKLGKVLLASGTAGVAGGIGGGAMGALSGKPSVKTPEGVLGGREHPLVDAGDAKVEPPGSPPVAETRPVVPDHRNLETNPPPQSEVAQDSSPKATDSVPIPESPATIDAQMQAMRDGKRDAVLVTEGAAMPDKGEFAKLKTEAGTFIYDPKRIEPTEIKAAVAEDRVGDILGLGTPRKPAPEDATGVVVVRTPEGIEKQAVVASEATMPAVTEAAQKMAGPGDTVGLEQPGKVIGERLEAKAASKPQVSRTEEPTAPEAAPVQRGVPEEREPTQTSARKEWLDTDRNAMLGTDTVDSPHRRGWKEALETAQKQGLHEGPKAMALAAEVNAKPRSLNDIQTAGLVQHAAELKVAHRDLMKQIEGSKDAGELAELAAKATHIEGAFDTLTTAMKRSGTEKGRALASQKLTLDADLSLVAVKARAKAAKGESLSPAEHKAFEELTQRFEKIEGELKEARAKLDESIADQAVRRHKGDTRHRGKTKVDYRQTVDEVRALLKAGCL